MPTRARGNRAVSAMTPLRRRARLRPGAAEAPDPLWYKNAIIYELHVRSFCDSDGTGVGDFRGLIDRLDYLQDLGITAIWMLPFYPSPLRDDGYDIADYMSVNPAYGTFEDVRLLIDEAHRRGIRVITELVVNHTSDQHPWFQRARRSPAGSKERDFYVWSDTPTRYKDARIIFKDFETSNWSWDPVAKQYYWHRFYSHQPDLNFDNPAVHEAVKHVLDHWMEAGVDGMRLDAIPYLFEREGTNCENLPETHAFLRSLRKHVDDRYPGRMLLAEANQWPEDAIAYFGSGDECHMSFHFPLMPRLFMAIRMEDRFPIIDILDQTPAIPANCQWALFLRNHDELTLEMVTDEERDYMYRVYAGDGEARINLGIRRRLAPLLGNNRRKIELMNALLFSLPGTPVIYYGDEIGMGDNVYLGDRDGVRTPMQWSADRNAGFSRASPQRLFLPIIIEPEYNYETINVESQYANPSSLLWWMKRLIALRKRHPVFGSGTMEFLTPSNPKVLAFVRSLPEKTVLVVANLSRFAQPTDLDLSRFKGQVPIEMFGQTAFPAVGETPYFITLGPHSFYWFSFAPSRGPGAAGTGEPSSVVTLQAEQSAAEWLMSKDAWGPLETVLASTIQRRRWFVSKAKIVRTLRILDAVPLRGAASTRGNSAVLFLAQVEYADREPDVYSIPIAIRSTERVNGAPEPPSVAAIAHVRDADGKEWLLCDAMSDPAFAAALLDAIAKSRSFAGYKGEVAAARGRGFGAVSAAKSLAPRVSKAEQTNSSAIYGDRFILKFFRRLEAGMNPDLEICRHLTERVGFPHTPPLAGMIEYRGATEEPQTLGMLQGFVANQGDAWEYALDQFARFVEHAQASVSDGGRALRALLPRSGLDAASAELPVQWTEMLGEFGHTVALLGRRTAAMHAGLADDRGDPAFTPEPYTQLYQRSLAQSMRNTLRRSYLELRTGLARLPEQTRAEAEAVLKRESDVLSFFRSIGSMPLSTMRIRCHGDFHLGQVLWTGKDFVIIDFEGEPMRSLGERRLKRSPLRDVAGMLRSVQYASATGLRRQHEGGAVSGESPVDLAKGWEIAVGSTFLRSYIAESRSISPALLPADDGVLRTLLRLWLLEKCLYEVIYELNTRPDWVPIPLSAVCELIEQGR